MNAEESAGPVAAQRPTRLSTALIQVTPGRWLGLMLLALHAAVVVDADSVVTRAFLLAHYGLFLLWQPLIRSETRIEPRLALPVFAMAALLVLVDSTWVMALWLSILAGLVGAAAAGQTERGPRLAYLLALTYLLALLLAWVLPQTLGDRALSDALGTSVRYGLPLLPLVIVFLPASRQRAQSSTLDFIYGLMLSLLVIVLALGVFAVVAISRASYAWALMQTLLGMAALLLALSLLWNPRAGFAGLGQVTSRYLLSVGLPFEAWARRLATLAERERDPESFVRDALADLRELPWIRGGRWQAARGEGRFGEAAAHETTHQFHGLALTWQSARTLTPALALHVRLLSQLLGYFYAAKVREQTLREQAYSQAIHDTGARLTHDVKNILQSMKTLLAAVDVSTPEDSERLLALMKRQLPQLASRLSQTVDKLKQPAEMDGEKIAARDWWAALRTRYEHDDVRFLAEEEPDDTALPKDLFDSVADNLLANALRKRQSEPGVAVEARLMLRPLPSLTVTDSGSAAPEHVARNLFQSPVASASGLGVGLYQAARQAARVGYGLALPVNVAGQVRFTLAARGSPQDMPGERTG
ncbi:MAG TPA: sensor histidine kinase [Thiobacillus sp.]|nr:MAG: ATP-binding protein [Hydrogenophilales bacterium 16-64-46]OZA38976.1 MAG: ATP-binding protein [Hydrogenophilales bacterium 17-64-34]HQS82732.1 sensor histidine kinase [Thiobacillus sp.]HQT01277.1 sensor histidine kinase [Thiobacillus sp.]